MECAEFFEEAFEELTNRVGWGGGEEGGETGEGIDVETMNRSLGFDLSTQYHKSWENFREEEIEIEKINIIQPKCN